VNTNKKFNVAQLKFKNKKIYYYLCYMMINEIYRKKYLRSHKKPRARHNSIFPQQIVLHCQHLDKQKERYKLEVKMYQIRSLI
jgi:hypothetical protein